MQSRTIREGSVGLLVILGISLLTLLALWLRGFQWGARTYTLELAFQDISGLQMGSPVQFRGVDVGEVTGIQPSANRVLVKVRIDSASLLIPRDVRVEANQSGFIGESVVLLTPQQPLPAEAVSQNLSPLEPNCNSNLIVCNGDRLEGQVGVSYDELVRSMVRLVEVIDDPTLMGNLNLALTNVSTAATGFNQLSQDARRELAGVSATTRSLTATATQVQQFARTSEQTVTQVGDQLTNAANRVGTASDQVSSLVQVNRGTLVTTLNNLDQASQELRLATQTLSPAVNRLTQGELIQNLEALSANAAQASANLQQVSTALNTPENLLLLQQTLDSARVTFQNTQKITSDLDELTGDPAFRRNLRNLVNGLSGLVSSTQDLEQQVEVARRTQPGPMPKPGDLQTSSNSVLIPQGSPEPSGN
jgi:phospholipid/cholesterol/gamma-HCH transport system substrate-binding protein